MKISILAAASSLLTLALAAPAAVVVTSTSHTTSASTTSKAVTSTSKAVTSTSTSKAATSSSKATTSTSKAVTSTSTTSSAVATQTCVDTTGFVVRDGINYTTYDHCATGSHIELVKNSGICETTPGVNQYSGYVSFGTDRNVNMFFWFFEARKNATTAPLATWFNGGPGCSSLIGLFQENGPCQFVNGSTEPSINPYSWNTYANMLYVDQPVGTGFSFSNDGLGYVNSTNGSAPYYWTFMQAFYSQFTQYENQDLGVFSESYGGHFAPTFIRYIQEQNALITKKVITGIKINVASLGINNGWYDMKTQVRAYIDFAINNKYRAVITPTLQAKLNTTFTKSCAPALDKCQLTGTNADCHYADGLCYDTIINNITASADFDIFDIRAPADDPNPPETYIDYLARPAVLKAIGARVNYTDCAQAVDDPFDVTGDEARSSLFDMSVVVASGVNTVMWHGDADMDCNWLGGLTNANNITWSGQAAFKAKSLAAYNVAGVQGGLFKTQGNLTFLQVYASGHEVPFYQPKLALQVFEQTLSKKCLTST